MEIAIKHLNKSFGKLEVYKDFSVKFPVGKITCFLGPSGCGKTTLLNIISGLITADSGNFSGIDGKAISYLFQETRLLNWKTVWENIEFILKDICKKPERHKIVEKYIEMVELKNFKDYYPSHLSEGMKQRVSIARAFAYPSDILIMDEPFKALDLKLRMSLIESFIKLWSEDKRTVIFITHDIEEAVFAGDNIHILSNMPTIIIKSFTNEIPRNERKFGEMNNDISKGIYEIILDSNLK